MPTTASSGDSGDPYIVHPVDAAHHGRRPEPGRVRRSRPRCCTTWSRTAASPTTRSPSVRRRGRPPRRRRHQAERLSLVRARARLLGRERPGGQPAQDVPGDGRGHPRRPHQAGRPPAQHAHARRPAAGRSSSASPARRWRSTRRWPTGWASGRCKWELEDLAFRYLEPDDYAQIAGSSSTRSAGARALRRAGRASCCATSSSARASRPSSTGRAKHIYSHLPEDAEVRRHGQVVRRDLRPARAARPGRHGRRLLPRARRRPRPLAPAARPVRRLHRQPQGEHVPVAPHHRDGPRRASARGADPHLRDAPHRRVRRRRPLALQGRRHSSDRAFEERIAWLRQLLEWQRETAEAEEFVEFVKTDLFQRPGLRLHPQGRDQGPAGRRHAASTSPSASTPTSATTASARRSTAAWCR